VVEAVSERDGYGPGVSCWVDTWQPDLDAAVAFYGRLLGWEAQETRPPLGDPQGAVFSVSQIRRPQGA
jgi:predicted enzyme related to lactoylglutathione lyase